LFDSAPAVLVFDFFLVTADLMCFLTILSAFGAKISPHSAHSPTLSRPSNLTTNLSLFLFF